MNKLKFFSTKNHIFSLLLGASLLCFSSPENALAAQKATVKGSYVNIRSGPGLNYAKITDAKQGVTFKVIKVNNGWYNLQLTNNKNGWALGSLLTVQTIPDPKPTTASQPQVKTQSGKVVVTGAKVNVRSGPGTSYAVITSYNKGSNLNYTAVSNNWYKVVLPNKKYGWVINTYVKTVTTTTPANPPKEENTPTPPITAKKVIVKGTNVNVRSGPSTSHAIVTTLPKGTSVTYSKVSNNWYNVNLPNKKTGWVSGSYVEVVKQDTSNPPVNPNDPQNNPSQETEKIVLMVTDGVAIRSTPDNTVTDNILKYGIKNETYQLLKTQNGWLNIQLPNGQTGWIVETDGVVKEELKKIVLMVVDGAAIRSTPDNTNVANILSYGTKNETYRLLLTENGWHNIQLPNGQTGWIVETDGLVSDLLEGDQGFQQIILPYTKGIISYTADTYQNPYRLVVKVNNVHPNSSKIPNVQDNPFVSEVKAVVDATNPRTVTYTFMLKGPIHYTVYTTPGEIKSNGVISETDTFDKKLTIKITPLTIKGKKIVIDAGHGGAYPDPRADSGAVARDSSGKLIYNEKLFNLDMALVLAQKLEDMGAEVILTRATDVYIPLLERARIANQAEADIFLSIHANSGSSTASGTETIKNTSVSTSKPFLRSQLELRNLLAQNVQKSLLCAIQTKDRKAYEDVRGLAVLRATRMPSALVEVGFLSNAAELKKLMSPEFRGLAAKGIAQGLEKYFTTAK